MHELVGYLGLPGSWTHQVTTELFGESSRLQGYDAQELLDGYVNGEIPWICVPYFSSIAGPTPYLAQLLSMQGLWIERDVVRPVQHSLAVLDPDLDLSAITQVIGHPVALEEVKPWLELQLPQASWTLAKSGSDAASMLAQTGTPSDAAVTPPQAALTHHLHTRVLDIPTDAPNITRWWLLGPRVPLTPNQGPRVWLKVAGRSQEALCELEKALPYKEVEPVLWLHASSGEFEATHWLVVCLRSEELYAFLVLASVHGLAATLMGAQDEQVSDLVTSNLNMKTSCLSFDVSEPENY